MEYKNFKALLEKLNKVSKKTVVAAAAEDEHTLEAVFEAYEKGFADYILVGNKDAILQTSEKLSIFLDKEKIINTSSDSESASKAVELVRNGVGGCLMKGRLETPILLRAVVDKETGIRTGGVMSHIGVTEIPNYHKLLAVTDGGMVMYPDLPQKEAVLKNAVGYFNSIGYDKPKVGALCSIETVNPKMPETVDAASLKEKYLSGSLGNCIFEGPISFDLAVSKESAMLKRYESPVAGDIDIFLVPNITCGNALMKSMLYMAGAKMAGCVVGAKVPIILLSRGASAEEKLMSICLAVSGE